MTKWGSRWNDFCVRLREYPYRKLPRKIATFLLIERMSILEAVLVIQVLTHFMNGTWGYMLLWLLVGSLVIALLKMWINEPWSTFLYQFRRYSRDDRRRKEQSALAVGEKPPHNKA